MLEGKRHNQRVNQLALLIQENEGESKGESKGETKGETMGDWSELVSKSPTTVCLEVMKEKLKEERRRPSDLVGKSQFVQS